MLERKRVPRTERLRKPRSRLAGDKMLKRKQTFGLWAAMQLLVPSLMLWAAVSAAAMEELGPLQGNDIGLLPRQGGILLDDAHLRRPGVSEPPPARRFEIVKAGPHVILLDTLLGNTWLLRAGQPDRDDVPEWVFIFREIVDDERRPAAPSPRHIPAANEDTEDEHFDPFAP